MLSEWDEGRNGIELQFNSVLIDWWDKRRDWALIWCCTTGMEWRTGLSFNLILYEWNEEIKSEIEESNFVWMEWVDKQRDWGIIEFSVLCIACRHPKKGILAEVDVIYNLIVIYDGEEYTSWNGTRICNLFWMIWNLRMLIGNNSGSYLTSAIIVLLEWSNYMTFVVHILQCVSRLLSI